MYFDISFHLLKKVYSELRSKIKLCFVNKAKYVDWQPPVQFVSEDIKRLNWYLGVGRYFYT